LNKTGKMVMNSKFRGLWKQPQATQSTMPASVWSDEKTKKIPVRID